MIRDINLKLLFESVFETAVDGIVIIDSNGLIINVNQATCLLFGYSKNEMIGQNVSMLMNAHDAKNHDSYLHRYTQTKKPSIIGIGREVVAKSKSGHAFPVRLAVSEVILNDRIVFTGIIHDLSEVKKAYIELESLNLELDRRVTERTYEVEKIVNQLLATNKQLKKEVKERIQAEQQLISKENELHRALSTEKELNELKSRFVSTASHEFRTPLATILSSASIILKYNKEIEQENREKHVLKIKNAVTHLTGLLNDFLSLSKLEEGRVSLTPEELILNDILIESREDLSGILKKNQQIVFESDDNLPISTDKNILKNILFNIISNAIKYSEKDIKIITESNENNYTISIIDQGIGIPEEDVKHLFTRFFRAKNVGNIQGTGLGLNIVKRYCDLLHATINVSSIYSSGTTVIICIPKK